MCSAGGGTRGEGTTLATAIPRDGWLYQRPVCTTPAQRLDDVGQRAVIYLASPYFATSEDLMEQRYLAAIDAVAHLLQQRRWVYSPIVHCHELAKRCGLPRDFTFWRDYNFAMLDCANEFCVLQLPGWEESKGVAAESAYAQARGLQMSKLVPRAKSASYRAFTQLTRNSR